MGSSDQSKASSGSTPYDASIPQSSSSPSSSPPSSDEVLPPEGGAAAGYLEVFIDRARDIQNICIYHKQDVYAKICLSSDSEEAVSTKIVNGGGRNPIFEETLKLKVRSLDSSLRCEIWMLSRVKNYLHDQLLGFTVVPLSEIAAAADGNLAGEFSLSSTDLFHSPSGFVRLSLSLAFAGKLPAAPPPSSSSALILPGPDPPAPWKLDSVEFPDLNFENENQKMVSELLAIPCQPLESSDSSESSIVSPNSSPPPPPPPPPPPSSSSSSSSPAIKIDVQPEQKVVQQDIVDMYMKSMNQFTESLAKMKLPMDANESGGAAGAEKGLEASKETRSRVFYGSRAFF